MTKLSSAINDGDWKYPVIQPYAQGYVNADSHDVYWEEYGNPGGEPVLFLHGGPGGGSSALFARFFNPERYRVILFDQRGCGKSLPSAAGGNPLAALKDNTTGHLINDMLMLAQARGISSRMHLFGGSWGSTLALAFAIRHPERVQTLVLRGIFLCRKKDLDYFYQGNAATFDAYPDDTSKAGAYLMFPETWKRFVGMIDPSERHDMVAAYAKAFTKTPETEAEKARFIALATAWSLWEGVTSYLAHDADDLEKFANPAFAAAFARIENHYFMNGAFLGGTSDRNQNHILDQCSRLKNTPVYIVHGRYDQVCPVFQAEELVTALRLAGNNTVDYRITLAGHSMLERENCLSLTEIMDTLPAM